MSPDEATKLVMTLLEASTDKIEALVAILDDMLVRLTKKKTQQDDPGDIYVIEKARPIGASLYALERPEEWITGIATLLSIRE